MSKFGDCIILNGPPNCGKDTLADFISEYYNFHKFEFKESLSAVTRSFFGVSKSEWDARYTRELKELPWDRLSLNTNIFTPRQALQYVSERVCKPVFGRDFFGKQTFEINKHHPKLISADGGFKEEMIEFNENSDNFIVVRLHRENCDFTGDTRSYIYDFPSIDIDIIEGNVKKTAEIIMNACLSHWSHSRK